MPFLSYSCSRVDHVCVFLFSWFEQINDGDDETPLRNPESASSNSSSSISGSQLATSGQLMRPRRISNLWPLSSRPTTYLQASPSAWLRTWIPAAVLGSMLRQYRISSDVADIDAEISDIDVRRSRKIDSRPAQVTATDRIACRNDAELICHWNYTQLFHVINFMFVGPWFPIFVAQVYDKTISR